MEMGTLCRLPLTVWWLFVILPAAASSSAFCLGDDWTYHSPTKTCMKVMTDSKGYTEASVGCGRVRAGNVRKTRGRLVHILDKETDDFVKDLLADSSVNKAYIGLLYFNNDVYKWSDQSSLGAYTGWRQDEPNSDRIKSRVVVTREGWEAIAIKGKAESVCQIDAVIVLPPPTLTCPAAEEGKDSPPLTCTAKLPEGVEAQTLSFHVTGSKTFAATCRPTTNTCNPDDNYEASINTTSREITSSLTIKPVTREHGTTWSCLVAATDVADTATSNCSLIVYTPPDVPRCTHQFKESAVEVTCISDKVYPDAKCSWEYYIDTVKQTEQDEPYPAYTVRIIDAKKYFKTTCKMTFSAGRPGNYTFRVFIYPNIGGIDKDNSAARSADLSISVVPPPDPPVFYSSDGSPVSSPLELKENETVSISCDVTGGDPSPTYTRLVCDKEIIDVAGQSTRRMDGQSARMEIRLTKEMNGHRCTCDAKHISDAYNKTATVEFSVKFPAEVTSFEISGEYSYTTLVPGREVHFRCEAAGNPKPSLQLYRVGGDRKLLEPQTEVTDSTLLEHTVTAFCNISDEYACLARNDINTVGIRYANLKVNCPPEHCDLTDPNPQIRVDVNEDATIHLCVLAYPEPTVFQLSKGTRDSATKMADDRYDVVFNYTVERRTEGLITLTIKQLTSEDIGEYSLDTGYGVIDSARSTVYFELAPLGLLQVREKDQNIMTPWILPVVIAVLVAIVVAAMVIVLLVKRRGKPREAKTDTDSKMEGRQLVEMNAHDEDAENRSMCANDESTSNFPEKEDAFTQNDQTKDPKITDYGEVRVDNNKQDDPNMVTPPTSDPTVASLGENCNANVNTMPSDTSTDKEPETGQEKTSSDDGRTVNADGLVYVEVEVNKATTNPEIVSGASQTTKPLNQQGPEVGANADSVEYTSLDFEAGAVGNEGQERD